MLLNKELQKKMYFIRLIIISNYPFYGYIYDMFGIKILDDKKITSSILVYKNKIYLDKDYIIEKSIVVLAYKIHKELKIYLSRIYYNSNGKFCDDNPQNIALEEYDLGIKGGNECKIKNSFDDSNNATKHSSQKNNSVEHELSEIFNNNTRKVPYGDMPSNMKRFIKPVPFTYNKIDWKDLLKQYLTYDLEDYDFNPPDRRYQNDFILPAFNEVNETLKDLVFMIDISESMKEKTIKMVFNEVRNAFYSFRGRIKAYVGWFDYDVKGIVEIDDWDDEILSKVKGKGGTSFENLFNYIENSDFANNIKTLVVLTDGYSKYPQDYLKYDFDTIWVMTEDVKPAFGKFVKCN